jgi:hypothetical protein
MTQTSCTVACCAFTAGSTYCLAMVLSPSCQTSAGLDSEDVWRLVSTRAKKREHVKAVAELTSGTPNPISHEFHLQTHPFHVVTTTPGTYDLRSASRKPHPTWAIDTTTQRELSLSINEACEQQKWRLKMLFWLVVEPPIQKIFSSYQPIIPSMVEKQ